MRVQEEEEEERQRRWSGCSQHPPSPASRALGKTTAGRHMNWHSPLFTPSPLTWHLAQMLMSDQWNTTHE